MNKRAWFTTLAVVVIGGFALRFGWTFPWARVFDVVAGSDRELLAAAALANIVSLAAKAAAWCLLLQRLAPLRPVTAQLATFAAAAVNSVSVSMSGEAVRAQVVATRDGVPLAAVVRSLVVTRLVEAAGLVVFLAVACIAIPPWPWARLIGLTLVVAGAMAVVATSAKHGDLARPLAFTSFGWLAQWLTYHWSMLATHLRVTPTASLAALVTSNIAGIFRITPGNIGVIQGSLLLVTRGFRIPAADAMAAGLTLQAVQTLPILAIGLAIAGGRGLRALAVARG